MAEDYIKRENAIELAKDSQADLALEGDNQSFVEELESIPPADVAPVVRCKDCVYRVIMRDPLRKPMDCYGCNVMHYNEDNWFCSFGERKDEEADKWQTTGL